MPHKQHFKRTQAVTSHATTRKGPSIAATHRRSRTAPISQQPPQSRYNLRSSKRAGVGNDNSGHGTGEPSSQASGTGGTGEPSPQASGTGITSQASGTGTASQADDFEVIPLRPEVSRLLTELWNDPRPLMPENITLKDMEQAGFGDLAPECRAALQQDWLGRAFVKNWDNYWKGERPS